MFLGGNKWDEIFRAGNHTDSQGRVRSWSEADLDRIVQSYDPAKHEAPIVVGHPKDNAPAFGWVSALKREGKALLAQYSQVAAEFVEAVRDGRYKKRSISIYPDGTLRHVGWLGAQPPAIKGLPDFAFSDGDGDPHTYEESTQEGNRMTIEEMQAKLAEEQKARADAEAKVSGLTQEVGELKTKVEKSEAEFAENEKKRIRAEIESSIDAGIQAGKILPSWKKAGLVEFMASLNSDESTYEFSEGKKQTPAKWFQEFIMSFCEHPLFTKMSKDFAEKKGQDNGETEDQKAVSLLTKTGK